MVWHLLHNLFGTFNTLDVRLEFAAPHHHLMAAGQASDAEIHAHTQHRKTVAAAGMIFFAGQDIAYLNIQFRHLQAKKIQNIL